MFSSCCVLLVAFTSLARILGECSIIHSPPTLLLLFCFEVEISSSSHHHHPSLNRQGRRGTTDNFTISFLHFSLFSTARWDLPNSRPVHSLMLSSHLVFCLPCFLPPFTVPCKMVLARPDERETFHTTSVCGSLRWSGCLRVVRLPAGSWHGLPRW